MTGPNYDIRNFREDSKQAKEVSESEYKDNLAIFNASKKAIRTIYELPDIDLESILKATNNVLQSKVEVQKTIKELENNPNKQNFAREGLKIHNHKKGEVCAFCGNEITDERWTLLESYFSNKVTELSNKIDNNIFGVSEIIKQVNKLEINKPSEFHERYQIRIKEITTDFNWLKSTYTRYLNFFLDKLKEKQNRLFESLPKIDLLELGTEDLPNSFTDLNSELREVIYNNSRFDDNLDKNKAEAKKLILGHEVAIKLNQFNFQEKYAKLISAKSDKEEIENKFNAQREQLFIKNKEKQGLISKTRNEEKAVVNINKLLCGLGNQPFQLKCKNSSDAIKGQYVIIDEEGERSVDSLSTGEKIWFLFFGLCIIWKMKN